MFSLPVGDDAQLRLLEESQAEELYALTERNRARLRQWLPWLDNMGSAGDSRSFIRATRRQFDDGYGYQAGLYLGERLAGVLGFPRYDSGNRLAHLGYWIDAELEGRGLVTRGCRAAVRHAFTELRLNRIEIRCATDNARSRAIPPRLGFTEEGVLREVEWLYDHFVDHAVYALLKRDWRDK